MWEFIGDLFLKDNYFNDYLYNCLITKKFIHILEYFNGVLFLFSVEYYFLYRVFEWSIISKCSLFHHGNLVSKFKRIFGKPDFSDQFKKIVKRYLRAGYTLDIMRHSACIVLNQITVYSYGFLFNCTTVGQASDSMTALT